MNKISWTTAAFLGARPDRPWIYYLAPLQDHVALLRKADVDFRVWTWKQSERVVRAVAGQSTRIADPTYIADSEWRATEWRPQLPGIHVRPTSIEATTPVLLDIWLSKMSLVWKTIEETNAEVGFWVDAGMQVSWQCEHQYDSYTPTMCAQWTLAGLHNIAEIATERGCVICGDVFQPCCDHPQYGMWVGVQRSCNGCLFAISREHFGEVMQSVVSWWNKLVESGRISTDEPAIALASLENEWPIYSYKDWIGFMR